MSTGSWLKDPGSGVKKRLKKALRMFSSDPLIDSELGGYRLERKIGKGAIASVYKATKGGEDFAVKVLSSDYAKSERSVRKFMAEAETIERIDNACVVRGFGHGREGERFYLSMEYIDGRDLELEIKHLDLIKCLRILLDSCRGLEAIHDAGLVHGDIKPANIMVSGKIIDLGLVKEISEARKGSGGMIYGTINYVSPEIAGGSGYGFQADIYSLGVTAYRMISGTLPFESQDLLKLIDLIKKIDPFPPSRRAPERAIPASVDEIVMRAIEKEPGARFKSAQEMAQGIEKILIGI